MSAKSDIHAPERFQCEISPFLVDEKKATAPYLGDLTFKKVKQGGILSSMSLHLPIVALLDKLIEPILHEAGVGWGPLHSPVPEAPPWLLRSEIAHVFVFSRSVYLYNYSKICHAL